MACARERRHVVADLGHEDGRHRVTQAGHRQQQADGGAKGRERLGDVPRRRNLKGALASDTLRSQYGVLAGLRVKLIYGLAAPMRGRSLCPRRALLYSVS